MKIETTTITVDAKGCDIIDLTGEVREFLVRAGIAQGQITVFCPGANGAVTTMMFEPGAVEDVKRALERLAPAAESYANDGTWGERYGATVLKASLLNQGVTVPVMEGSPTLGSGQQIVFISFNNAPCRHPIVLQAIGESRQIRDPSIDLG